MGCALNLGKSVNETPESAETEIAKKHPKIWPKTNSLFKQMSICFNHTAESIAKKNISHILESYKIKLLL
jgi:hypothetical protein